MIRADDLGYSEGVNYGIAKAVRDGKVKNIGFMVNMPASKHGWNLIQDLQDELSIGLHTNICTGYPLSDMKNIPSLVQENGQFHSSKEYRQARESHIDSDLVSLEEAITEIEAQLQQFKKITGRDPDYFEAHAIESDIFNQALKQVADKYNLLYQPADFSGAGVSCGKETVYMYLDSMQPDYDPMESFIRMHKNAHEDGVDLLVLHPGYLDEDILQSSSLTRARPKETAFACSSKLENYLAANDITLIQYRDFRR